MQNITRISRADYPFLSNRENINRMFYLMNGLELDFTTEEVDKRGKKLCLEF